MGWEGGGWREGGEKRWVVLIASRWRCVDVRNTDAPTVRIQDGGRYTSVSWPNYLCSAGKYQRCDVSVFDMLDILARHMNMYMRYMRVYVLCVWGGGADCSRAQAP